MIGEVALTPKGERWRKSGHPWVYKDDLTSSNSSGAGEVVRVKAPNGRLLGQAFFNPRSKIALRWLTDDPDAAIDRNFWAQRLARAAQFRKRIVEESTAYRLISSESDGFPGLIVDRYNSILVLQSLSLGIDNLVPVLVELLREVAQPAAIVARNDSHVRVLEGLTQEKKILWGEPPGRVEVTEGTIRYLVDVWEGQKTGAYLDQRENRLRARHYSRGRVLDAFAYHGGFTLQAASLADEVLSIEDSESALKNLQENLNLNGITNVQAERANAFDRLRALEKEGEKFDLVILDPPAFAKNKNEISDAVRGYREINLRAIRLLRPDGTLISCSCSYNISEELFIEILRAASADAGRSLRVAEVRTQSRDHPIVLTHPESKYLKCVVLEAL